METITAAIIVLVLFTFLVSLVTIILVSISYASSPPLKGKGSVAAVKPVASSKSVASHAASSGASVDVKVQQTQAQKIVKTPKRLTDLKRTPRSPTGRTDRLYVFDTDGNKSVLLPTVTEPVVDVAKYRDGLLVLLNYGNMIYLTTDPDTDQVIEYHLPSTQNIMMITPFKGTVVGLGYNGRMYIFDFYDENNYRWVQVFPSVSSASYISSPEDGSELFIKTSSSLLTFDGTMDIIANDDATKSDIIKVYGSTNKEMRYINRLGQTSHRSIDDREPETNVYDGCFASGQFIPVSYSEYSEGVLKCKSIDNQLYYIINN
jgi:hypothetical protein